MRCRPWRLFLLFLICLPSAAGLQAAEPGERPLQDADRAHWAFQKPAVVLPPAVKDAGWVRTPVDAFILARLERAGLHPAPPADRAALLRRVTFDLTGLPPTPAELDVFLADASPDAYAHVVDRLLASPHYGERWAQHWLDVVRYAESNGYEADGERPHAWRYRDYVIRAFNDDLPWDRFVTEQLAGDLLARGKDPRACPDLLIATGFNRCGPVHLVGGNTDAEVNRQEVLTEMTNAVGAAFLGLTIGCARCHDHKFDPLSIRDYYRLQAFFAAALPKEVDLSTAEERAAHGQLVNDLNARLAPLRKQVSDLETPYRDRLTAAKKAALEPKYREALAVELKDRTPQQVELVNQAQILLKVTWDEIVGALSPADRERRATLRAQIHALEAQTPGPTAHAWAVADVKPVPPTHVLKRGDTKKKDVQVEPAFPRVLSESSGETALQSRPDGSGEPSHTRLDRLALTRWLTQPDHPLTARVLVNRVWQHHFGRGLVSTPNDFGVRGQPPSHPELLDWLAGEFVAHGWSLKHLHRLLLLSNTYQQASHVPSSAGQQADPDNRLLWRMNRQRLEGEALRDAMLAVTGSLTPALGGPMVRVPLEPEVYELIFTEGEPDGLWHPTLDRRAYNRRSIYLFAKRNVRLPMLEAFDQPDTLTSCPVRPVSTFSPQALILLNGPFIQEQSKAFAARLLREAGSEPERQVAFAYRLALGRLPGDAEKGVAGAFLASQTELVRDRLRNRLPVRLPAEVPGEVDPAAAAALTDFCQALLNRNEFVYVP
jgi:hypothetical protein